MPETECTSPDAVFAALADPTRLRIVNLLAGGELCVCDLVEVLNLAQPKVSRHLAVLRKTGLVLQRVDANWRHYRLAEPTSELHQRVLDCLACCGGYVPQLQVDQKSLGKLSRCCAPATASTVKRNLRR